MKPKSTIWSAVAPYKFWVTGLVALVLVQNAINLVIPSLTSRAIDAYGSGGFDPVRVAVQFSVAAALIAGLLYVQSVVQVVVSERIARNVRTKLADKISRQTFQFIQGQSSSKLLTNLTSDVDGVKAFVGSAISTIFSSLFLIVGAATLLIVTDWKLGLAVMAVIPLTGVAFALMFRKVGGLFQKSQEVIDRLNRTINQSVLGSALIRVVNSQQAESEKFLAVNERAKSVGISILKVFASMIPIVMAVSNVGLLIVLVLGGHFVIGGSMTVGDLAAFNGYIAILIFPIIMLGFLGSTIARANASYARIAEILDAPDASAGGTAQVELSGTISAESVTVSFGEKTVLDGVSFSIKSASKVAIVGPTAAGKTQLLYALSGLTKPASGTVSYDGVSMEDIDRSALHRQIALVFQDSVMFNLSVRENVMFGGSASEADLARALETAELADVIRKLPDGIETVVSERGTSLSGGQKQRIMLARALAMNPKVLFLDDFTARVDVATEKKILDNLAKNYPDLTLVSVTQKVLSNEHYDQVIVLMEGEVIGAGTHEELMKSSPEYVQIWNSQQSTNAYELSS